MSKRRWRQQQQAPPPEQQVQAAAQPEAAKEESWRQALKSIFSVATLLAVGGWVVHHLKDHELPDLTKKVMKHILDGEHRKRFAYLVYTKMKDKTKKLQVRLQNARKTHTEGEMVRLLAAPLELPELKEEAPQMAYVLAVEEMTDPEFDEFLDRLRHDDAKQVFLRIADRVKAKVTAAKDAVSETASDVRTGCANWLNRRADETTNRLNQLNNHLESLPGGEPPRQRNQEHNNSWLRWLSQPIIQEEGGDNV